MRITGLIITSPDVAATQDAWRRLGTLDREIEVTPGEGGLAAVVLGVDDVAATERLLQRRGLDGDAGGFDLGGLTWRLAPFVEGDGGAGDASDTGTDLVLDHVVVRTGDGSPPVNRWKQLRTVPTRPVTAASTRPTSTT